MKWSAIIPLLGGTALAAEQSTGRKPECIIDFEGFEVYSSHYRKNRPNVPYLVIKSKQDLTQAVRMLSSSNSKLIVAIPPCNGLCGLSNWEFRKSDAHIEASQWISKSAELAMASGCEIFIGENAPALFTKSGETIAKLLHNSCRKYNYNLTLIKISSLQHGLPQKRVRCYFVATKDGYYPDIEIEKSVPVGLAKFLEGLEGFEHSTEFSTPKKLKDNIYFEFAEQYYGSITKIRKRVKEIIANRNKSGMTIAELIIYDNLFDKAIQFMIFNYKEVIRLKRWRKKILDGKGIMEETPLFVINQSVTLTMKRLHTMVHPEYKRYLNIRECMHLMGIPNWFTLADVPAKYRHITQNVPVTTAKAVIDSFMNTKRKVKLDTKFVFKYNVMNGTKITVPMI
ncbi:MAG: DNA cytosine methyltransferase [Nitrosopumilus sp.]